MADMADFIRNSDAKAVLKKGQGRELRPEAHGYMTMK